MGHDSELSILRKFRKLNAVNLLYIQAEVTYLEKDLYDVVERDEQSGSLYFKDFLSLRESPKVNSGKNV